jgi:hypothetical protein
VRQAHRKMKLAKGSRNEVRPQMKRNESIEQFARQGRNLKYLRSFIRREMTGSIPVETTMRCEGQVERGKWRKSIRRMVAAKSRARAMFMYTNPDIRKRTNAEEYWSTC